MRQPMPLRWIEGAEARQVLTIAVSEAPPPPPPAPGPSASLWGELLRRWLQAGATDPAMNPALAEPVPKKPDWL